MIAALYVQKNGAYFGLPNVDPWDEKRDARLYDGPWPVVAHPPCARWCQLAYLVQATHGHKIGDDGGCFASALAAVRKFGGVLEHPAYTLAWPAHGLADPHRFGGWQRTIDGGWVCHVEQAMYGHGARKATWLYAFGVDLPILNWGKSKQNAYVISKFAIRDKTKGIKILQGRTSSKTPEAFKHILIAMAESANANRLPSAV
jgi:hypothetical protein